MITNKEKYLLTDGEIEVKQAAAKVKRISKKQAKLQAQLEALKTLQAAAIAPLEDSLSEANAALEAIKIREAEFNAKCAARKAARMAAGSKV